MAQKLWYNTNIRIAGKEISSLIGPMEVEPQLCKDVIDVDKGVKLSYEQYRNKYPNSRINYLVLLSIQAAIPKEWIKTLKIKGPPNKKLAIVIENIKTTKSKWAYKQVLSKKPRLDDKTRYKYLNILFWPYH